MDLEVKLPRPTTIQRPLVFTTSKRVIANCGRQSGKTAALGIRACRQLLQGLDVYYLAPTSDQTSRFFSIVTKVLRPLEEAGGARIVESPVRTVNRLDGSGSIIARTAFNPNSIRGGTFDEVLLDEAALHHQETYESVVQPMVATRDGVVILASTPTSIFTEQNIRGLDRRHFNKRWRQTLNDPEWENITFKTNENPFISDDAYSRLAKGMTGLRKRIELDAEIVDESPWALWKKRMIRHKPAPQKLSSVVVGVDPSGASTPDNSGDAGTCGIVAAGMAGKECYVLEDSSMQGTPNEWASQVVKTFHRFKADYVVVERNYGGDMCKSTIRSIDGSVPVREVVASRGKTVRAEPVASRYENSEVYHVYQMQDLEEQMCMWYEGCGWSPDRLDAMVWAVTELTRRAESTVTLL